MLLQRPLPLARFGRTERGQAPDAFASCHAIPPGAPSPASTRRMASLGTGKVASAPHRGVYGPAMTSERASRIFVHGLESSGQSTKAALLRSIFPDILTPTFTGTLEDRMRSLMPVLEQRPRWLIVGSSFGGLMSALWTCENPGRVAKLVLLAPALHRPEFADKHVAPIDVPTVLYHGLRDDIVPIEIVRDIAKRQFRCLEYHTVDDEHALRAAVVGLDWRSLLADEPG